jgi:hypothetical protein
MADVKKAGNPVTVGANAAKALDRLNKMMAQLGDKSSKTVQKNSDRSQGADGAKRKASEVSKNLSKPADKPRMCSANEGPTELIHRFTGSRTEGKSGIFGWGSKQETSYKLEQKEIKSTTPGGKSRWEVSVSADNRINQRITFFHSQRPVKADDFNNTSSPLWKKHNESREKLNDSSNLRPEQKGTTEIKQDNRWWIHQQASNLAGGTLNGFKSGASMVGSIPENLGKTWNTGVEMARIGANVVTGGKQGKTAFNPIHIDRRETDYNNPTKVQETLDRGQAKIDKKLGADPTSPAYIVGSILGPIVVTRTLGKLGAGSANSNGTNIVGGATLKSTGTSSSKLPLASKDFRSTQDMIKVAKNPDGSLKVTKNNRPVTREDLIKAVDKGRLTSQDLGKANVSQEEIRKIVQSAGQRRPATLAMDPSLKNVNASINKGDIPFEINPGYPARGRNINCYNTTLAMDRTLSGRPSAALPVNPKKYNYSKSELYKDSPFPSGHPGNYQYDIPNAQLRWSTKETAASLQQSVKALPQGARGIVTGYRANGTAHGFNFIVRQNGKVDFLDGQTMRRANLHDAFNDLRWTRTDVLKN